MDKNRFFPPLNRNALHGEAWFWRLPLVAMALIVAIFSFFIWFGLNQEREEREAALVSDTLWIEQNLRFQLDSTEESLAQIGNEFGISGDIHSDLAQEKVRSLLQGPSGLVAILWLDAYGNMMSTLPASSAPVKLSPEHDTTLQRARRLNKTAYTTPFKTSDNTYEIEAIVPVFGANDFNGYAVGIYSLSRLIEKQIPWWFAERYHLELTSSTQTIVATTAQTSSTQNEKLSFKVTMDRAGGLGIHVDAYRASTRVMPMLVAAVLSIFGLVIVWGFWMLRNHVVRLHAAEEALRREYTFRLAMENSTLVGLRAHDMEGRITYANAAFCRMVGWDEGELLGTKPPMPYWLSDTAQYPDPARLAGKVPQEGDPAQVVEAQFRRKDGEIIDVLISEAPLNNAAGQQTGWMGSVLDITERKKAESLARAQQERIEATARLVTMGETASILAHEINQPLSAIASYSAGCLNAIRAGRFNEQQFTDVLSKINYQAQRAGRIVRRIYSYVRRSEAKNEPMDINEAVMEAISLLETEAAKRRIRVQEELGSDVPMAYAEPMMIEQLLINLVRNAMDAMSETPDQDRLVRVRTETGPDNVVLVSVIDRGCGIPPEIADKLFDSFFTTKPDGMGMGLKVCRSVAEQHMGRLWFEPADGGGTTFILQIPAYVQETSSAA